MAKRSKPKPNEPKLDPETGWEIDEDTKDLIDPETDDVLSPADAVARIAERKAKLSGSGAPEQQPVPGPAVQEAVLASRASPLAPQELPGFDKEETTIMVFPKPVTLTRDDHSRVKFPAGAVRVPNSLVNHEYLKLCGAKPFE